MAFNLGAFAGGLVSGGLKTYQTMSEIERLRAAEERDKVRFEEEQRLITQRQESEALQRKAAIPTAADQPGRDINAVVSALPIGGSETSPGDLTKTTDAYQQKFKDVFGGLTPEQQALVLRQYGDASTPGGAALQQTQTTAGAPEALAGLNTAVVRQDAAGGRSVVQADTDEKKTVARYKAMAMASGNPVAIKAANEAEIAMLNRQVAEQSIEVGKQNIAMNVFKLSEAQSVADFTKRFNDNLVAAKTENNKLLKEVDEATNDPKATVESLLKQFGVQIKDGTGQSYYAKDGKVYTKDAGGNEIVVADSLDQAKVLLKQGAGAHFAYDLSNRIVKEGLFKSPEAFNDFYKAEREWVTASANIANTRVMAAAATSNAASAAVSAGASATSAKASADKVAAELKAGIPEAHASLYRAQAGSASAAAANYRGMLKLAQDNATLSADARREVTTILDKYQKLTPEQQIGPEGVAILTEASLAYVKKSGDVNGLINAIKPPTGNEEKPMSVDKFMESFGTSPSSFKDGNGNAIPIAQLSPSQAKAERDAMYSKGVGTGGLSDKTPPPAAPPGNKAAADASPKAAAPTSARSRGIPLQTTDGGKTFTLDVPDTIRDPSVKYYREVPNPVAAALSGKSFKSAAEAEAAYNAAVEAAKKAPAAPAAQAIPVAKSAGPSAAELAEDAEVAKVNAELAAKNKAAPAAPAGKSVKAREEDLSYKVIVAQSTYDRRPGATTKAQLDSAQQELASFRKANGIKP
jgi:hypothetical protein